MDQKPKTRRSKGLSRGLLYDRPEGIRVLRIAAQAYKTVPVGEILEVSVKPAQKPALADLIVASGPTIIVVERFSTLSVATEYEEAISGCLTRWRIRQRPHHSVSPGLARLTVLVMGRAHGQ